MRIYEPSAGERIEETCRAMVDMADRQRRRVRATFNGVRLLAHPGQLPIDIEQFYMRSMKRSADAYYRSPRGKAQAAALAENRRVIAEAEARGPVAFSIRDAAAWKKWTDANPDGYGAACVRYAALWANVMEREIANGGALADVADKASHEADVEGITGFMYGCAVQILSECWEHGEELRRWHNLKTQIGNEGERANESGGVLNPAVLTVGEVAP